MAHGQANAEIREDGGAPSLTCLHEAPIVAHAFKASHYTRGKDGAPSEVAPPLSADADKGDQDTLIAFDTTQITNPDNRSNPQPGDPCHPLASSAHPPAVAWAQELADQLTANEQSTYTHEGSGNFRTRNVTAPTSMTVRRLTPRECERLQGFPDDYTAITYRGKPAADGPRYKALGNSMAVPVMRWIGERIALVDAIPEGGK
jgi:DNA (cytosine-5)-methyltransferase 1